MARETSWLAVTAIDQAIGVAQCRHRPRQVLQQRLQLRQPTSLCIVTRALQPIFDRHWGNPGIVGTDAGQFLVLSSLFLVVVYRFVVPGIGCRTTTNREAQTETENLKRTTNQNERQPETTNHNREPKTKNQEPTGSLLVP